MNQSVPAYEEALLESDAFFFDKRLHESFFGLVRFSPDLILFGEGAGSL